MLWGALSLAAILLGAFLLARNLRDAGGRAQPPAIVDSQYENRLAANIEFFETRVAETHDSLSYNRLVALYLERLRLTGDVSDVQRAEVAAERSLAAAPGTYASTLALAQVRLAQHDFEAALGLATEAAALRPNANEHLAISGDAKLALGRYKEAGEDYRRFLELAPGFSAFTREAVLAEAYGNLEVASQFWQVAIDASKDEAPLDSAWARVQLGNLQASTGDLKAAAESLDEALRVYPGYPLAQAGQARVAALRRDYRRAADLYAAVTARVPSPEFIAPYADVLLAKGDTAGFEQQAALIRAIGRLYEATSIRNDLTLILFELDHGNDIPAALESARTAYKARPSLAAADTYAWALYRNGDVAEARRFAEEALRLGTKDPLFLFHAGVIAKAAGDRAAALDSLQAAVRLNPEFHPVFAAEARRALEELGVKP